MLDAPCATITSRPSVTQLFNFLRRPSHALVRVEVTSTHLVAASRCEPSSGLTADFVLSRACVCSRAYDPTKYVLTYSHTCFFTILLGAIQLDPARNVASPASAGGAMGRCVRLIIGGLTDASQCYSMSA
ncbi:MAG: hypothetical protein ACJAY5_001657 [Actinomycetes bacterium]